MAASDEAQRREAAGRGGKASASRPYDASEGRGELEELVRLVAAGAGYRGLSRELIVSVGARELAKRRNLKEAVKATRSKLHQVTGAYFPRQEYDRWLALLREAAASGDREQVRAACRTILAQHASTRERLPILDELYSQTLRDVAPIPTRIHL